MRITTANRANRQGLTDDRLTSHALYRQPGAGVGVRQAAYRGLFRPELDDEAAEDIRKALELGLLLGSKRFARAGG